MFYLLGSTLCLAVLFLGTTLASLFGLAGSRLLAATSRPGPRTRADLLFALRVLPLATGLMLSFGLAVPAFDIYEPHATREMPGPLLLALAALGTLLASAMVVRAARILWTTVKCQQAWRKNSQIVECPGVNVPVHCVTGAFSLLAVTGFFRPRIFVSQDVMDALSPEELSAALAHEISHIQAFDNLKQLLFKITRAPRWLSALFHEEAGWTAASEMAADEAALDRGASVLELSSALIKVGRLKGRVRYEGIAASHLLPPAADSTLGARVAHLEELIEGHAVCSSRRSRHLMIPTLLLAIVAYAACIQAGLPWIHETLEWLVR